MLKKSIVVLNSRDQQGKLLSRFYEHETNFQATYFNSAPIFLAILYLELIKHHEILIH